MVRPVGSKGGRMTTTCAETEWEAFERLLIKSRENLNRVQEAMSAMIGKLVSMNESFSEMRSLIEIIRQEEAYESPETETEERYVPEGVEESLESPAKEEDRGGDCEGPLLAKRRIEIPAPVGRHLASMDLASSKEEEELLQSTRTGNAEKRQSEEERMGEAQVQERTIYPSPIHLGWNKDVSGPANTSTQAQQSTRKTKVIIRGKGRIGGSLGAALKMRNLLEEFYGDHGFRPPTILANPLKVGKGKDVGLNQIALFEGKVAGDNGEQVLNRDIYRSYGLRLNRASFWKKNNLLNSELEAQNSELRRAYDGKQEQENAMLQILMRVEQEQKVTEDARRFAEQDAAAQRYASQVFEDMPLKCCPEICLTGRFGQLFVFFRRLSFYFTTVGFYFCTMLTVLPWESVLRVWDVLLFLENRVMLFRTALSLMELHGPALVTTKEAGDAVTVVTGTVPVDRCVLDFATEPTDSLLGLITMNDQDEMYSSARVYEIGRRKPTDEDSDPDDAESEEDDDDEGEDDSILGQDLDGDSTTCMAVIKVNEMVVSAASLVDCQVVECGNLIWDKLTGHTAWPVIVSDEYQGGRAGRYRSKFPNGEVTCLYGEDLPLLHSSLSSPSPVIEQAGLFPNFDLLLMYSRLHPSYGLHQIMEHFVENAKVSPNYFITDCEELLKVAAVIDELPLTLNDKYLFTVSPVDMDDDISSQGLTQFAQNYSKNRIVRLKEIFTPGTLKVPKSHNALKELESIHKVLDLYVWLSFHMHDSFPDHELAASQKAICSMLIEEFLGTNLLVKPCLKKLSRRSQLRHIL
ncbi:ATP-dependent RNA and DNA helicase [Dorcoceras hygrometricum]|nr:ATP-dependent RNA and DNA helicase [Dorcoceras hygrometricum]